MTDRQGHTLLQVVSSDIDSLNNIVKYLCIQYHLKNNTKVILIKPPWPRMYTRIYKLNYDENVTRCLNEIMRVSWELRSYTRIWYRDDLFFLSFQLSHIVISLTLCSQITVKRIDQLLIIITTPNRFIIIKIITNLTFYELQSVL